jgi:hypothetical protein
VCLVMLAALGTGDLIERILEVKPDLIERRTAVVLAASAWAVTSLALAMSDGYRFRWREDSHLRAMTELGRKSGVCGVAVDDWPMTGGYSHLHRNVPIYDFGKLSENTGPTAFNAIIASGSRAPRADWGFSAVRCFAGETVYTFVDPGACLFLREGDCRAVPQDELSRVLRRGL